MQLCRCHSMTVVLALRQLGMFVSNMAEGSLCVWV